MVNDVRETEIHSAEPVFVKVELAIEMFKKFWSDFGSTKFEVKTEQVTS